MKFEPEYSVETDGILAGPIQRYLESPEKRMNDTILAETVTHMRKILVRDLMQPRDTRAGKESNTLYTGPCARKSRLTYDGAERDALRSRTLLKFLLGDLVEVSVLALARLAGCQVADNNIDLTIEGQDGLAVAVHPDGRVTEGSTDYNLEIKSCDSRTFDLWMEQGGPSDDWGYRTQASIEIQAWREYGLNVNHTVFVAVSTGSRQGSIAEWILPYEEQLVIGWHERRLLARQLDVPAIPFEAQPELQYKAGKELDATWLQWGEPTPRINAKGNTYGWDVFTGRSKVPMTCAYCDFRTKHCWQDAVLEMDGGKPVWIVPEKRHAQASFAEEGAERWTD